MRKLNSSSKFNEGSWVGDNEKKGTLWFEVIKSLEDPKLKLADHNLGKNGKILVHKEPGSIPEGIQPLPPRKPNQDGSSEAKAKCQSQPLSHPEVEKHLQPDYRTEVQASTNQQPLTG